MLRWSVADVAVGQLGSGGGGNGGACVINVTPADHAQGKKLVGSN